jgi:hypothetical protein
MISLNALVRGPLPPCRATPALQPSATHHMIHISAKPYDLIAIPRRSCIEVWPMSLLGLENRACSPRAGKRQLVNFHLVGVNDSSDSLNTISLPNPFFTRLIPGNSSWGITCHLLPYLSYSGLSRFTFMPVTFSPMQVMELTSYYQATLISHARAGSCAQVRGLNTSSSLWLIPCLYG